jgi:hypothetical protein
MTDPWDTHSDLHSERGGLKGEHPGRARNPVVKVHDLAWLQCEKPDLHRDEVDQAAVKAVVDAFTTPWKLEIHP